MRRKIILAAMVFMLSACSAVAPEPTATPTLVPTDTPTVTSTPLPTASATIVRIPTQNFNLPTFTPFVLKVDGNTVTPAPTPTSLNPGAGFLTLEYSPSKIYWGGCEPNSVSIRTEVEDPDQVISVIIFVRVKDFKEEDYTPWTSGAVMLNRGQGEFTYTLTGSEIYGHDHYLRSWVYFQLVATNIKGEEIGRTKVYEKAFDMYPCPCLTPLTGCPITPKPTKTP
jgi:hypothetical protein